MDFTTFLALLANLTILPFGDVNLAAMVWTILIMIGLTRLGLGFEAAMAAGAGFLMLFGAVVFVGSGAGITIIIGAAIGVIIILALLRIFRK